MDPSVVTKCQRCVNLFRFLLCHFNRTLLFECFFPGYLKKTIVLLHQMHIESFDSNSDFKWNFNIRFSSLFSFLVKICLMHGHVTASCSYRGISEFELENISPRSSRIAQPVPRHG